MRMMLALAVVFVVFVAFCTPAHATLLDIKEVRSEGGITAWLVEDHSVPVIAMKFGFKGAGAVNDLADKQGIARMLSNTLDEGAGDLDAQAFQKALRDQVISLGFSAGRDDFGGTLKTLTKNKARAFELLKLSLTEPRFEDEAITRMRQANQSRIRSSLSEPEYAAARILNDKAYAGHPYSMNSGGTLSSLDKITAKDLGDFHKNHIGMNNVHIAVAGDISVEELRVVLDDVFGALPQVEIQDAPDIALQNQGGVFHYMQDIPQTVIEIVQPGVARNSGEYFTAQVMNFILGSSGFGSRLTDVVREQRGLVYGIYTYLYNLDHVNALAISTSTEAKNVGEVLGLIREEFKKIGASVVSDKELADAKAYLIGSLPLSLSSTDKIAGLVNSLQMDGLGIDYLDRRQNAIENMTAVDIQTLAQKFLDGDKFVTVLVGKAEGFNTENIQTIESLPNVE